MKHFTTTMLLFVVIMPFLINAEQLVFVSLNGNESAELQLIDYKKPVFYENRFMLIHESDNWSAPQSNQEILTNWKNSKYYFVLYPLRNFDQTQIKLYAKILKATPDYLIIETDQAILNDLEIFHSFKIVRVFNQKIKPIDQSQNPISLKSMLFNTCFPWV